MSHTHTQTFNSPLSGTTRVSRYQKGKTNLDFTEARESGISWDICKSAPRSRQITMHPTAQFFTGQMPFLLPNQQRQSTEGKALKAVCQWLTQKTSSLLQTLCSWSDYKRTMETSERLVFNWPSNLDLFETGFVSLTEVMSTNGASFGRTWWLSCYKMSAETD